MTKTTDLLTRTAQVLDDLHDAYPRHGCRSDAAALLAVAERLENIVPEYDMSERATWNECRDEVLRRLKVNVPRCKR